MISGIAHGGPMDNQKLEGRYPAGVVLVDKPTGKVWIYDWDKDRHEFNVREEDGRKLDKELQWTAAESPDWEVRTW